MAFKMKQFSDDEAIRRVWDVEEIKNLIARFFYYEAGNARQLALDTLWVAEEQNKKSASFGRNWGFIQGMDAISAYYVANNRFGADGTQLMHPLSTKLLCLAEDGQTAQGLWMGIGYETAPDSKGELKGTWVNERMAVDFIREKDGWKIWHLLIGTNFICDAGNNYMDVPVITETREYGNGNPAWYMVGKENLTAEVAVFDQIPEYLERDVFQPTAPAEVYTALYNDQITFPHLPEDYRTFADVVSYDYDGFMSVCDNAVGKVI